MSGVRCQVSGVGCWVLGVGCWVLGVGCWVLGVGCWVLGVGCWVLGVGCWVLGSEGGWHSPPGQTPKTQYLTPLPSFRNPHPLPPLLPIPLRSIALRRDSEAFRT